MKLTDTLLARLEGLYDLGGPVVLLLLALSILSLAVVLWKFWQFFRLGVGRRRAIAKAIAAWDTGNGRAAEAELSRSRNKINESFGHRAAHLPKSRVEAETNAYITRLESGFRILDSIAQISPLLGLFGTVLGMIAAFQALQNAGNSVDPSLLAGGIWVALLTTAAGLAVAMPTSLMLSYFESRVARERTIAERAIEARFAHGGR